MFARTQRLLLRPGFVEDAPALAAAINDPAIIGRLSRVPYPYAEADARVFLTQPAEALLPRFLIMLRTAGAPELIGGIGLSRDGQGRRNLGYWLRRRYWGAGFATEAGLAICEMADAAELGPLSAAHFADNPASGRVLAKLGFTPTGEVRQLPSAIDGSRDSIQYVRNGPGDDAWRGFSASMLVQTSLANNATIQ